MSEVARLGCMTDAAFLADAQGVDARCADEGVDACPYASGHALRDAWLMGWHAADRALRDEALFGDSYSSDAEDNFDT